MTIIAHILFFGLLFALIIIPLLPAIIEWLRKTDSKALAISSEYNPDVQFFAKGFKKWVADHCDFFEEHNTMRAGAHTTVEGIRYQVVASGEPPHIYEVDRKRGVVSELYLGLGSMALPGNLLYESEIYSRGGIYSENDNSFRAVMAEEDLTFGERNRVLRWAHAGRTVDAGKESLFFGRLTANQSIRLADGVRFQRICAPVIQFGAQGKASLGWKPGAKIISQHEKLAQIGKLRDSNAGRMVFDDDLLVPTEWELVTDIVTQRHCKLGFGCVVRGSIKANGDLIIGDRAVIEGALVATGNIMIGAGARIQGPVISEATITLAADSCLGLPDRPTTISAERIVVDSGVVAHGSVWAKQCGIVELGRKIG